MSNIRTETRPPVNTIETPENVAKVLKDVAGSEGRKFVAFDSHNRMYVTTDKSKRGALEKVTNTVEMISNKINSDIQDSKEHANYHKGIKTEILISYKHISEKIEKSEMRTIFKVLSFFTDFFKETKKYEIQRSNNLYKNEIRHNIDNLKVQHEQNRIQVKIQLYQFSKNLSEDYSTKEFSTFTELWNVYTTQFQGNHDMGIRITGLINDLKRIDKGPQNVDKKDSNEQKDAKYLKHLDSTYKLT